MQSGTLGLLVVLAAAAFITALIVQSRIRPEVKSLLVLGLLLRIAGSQLYYYFSQWIYGFGDYSTYYGDGLRWGRAWLSHSPESFTSPYVVGWCCTAFTVRLTGLLLLLLGPTINGAFLAFAIFGYMGIIAIAAAFSRSFPDIPIERYLLWVLLFPSLWYWPAALGKDALVLGGTGMAVLGYVGRRGRTGWLLLIVGMAVVVAVRPQVAVVEAAAMIIAFWGGGDRGWSVSRVVQGIALVGGGLILMVIASGALGLHIFSPEEVGSYLDARSSASGYGGSSVQAGVLTGLVNVLFRPFPWEVRGFAPGISALEVSTLWMLAIWKWADIKSFLRSHRSNRLLWFAIAFTAMYVLLTGMALGNLGLIARQRVLIFPFLLMLFTGGRPVRPLQALLPENETVHEMSRRRLTARRG